MKLSLKHCWIARCSCRCEDLLRVKYIIRIRYEGSEYQLPSYMWLPKDFPNSAPSVYMDPRTTMERSRKCPFIDANLMLNCPYIREWSYPLSNLIDLYEEVQRMSEQYPPLRAKRHGGRSSSGHGSSTVASQHDQQRHMNGSSSHSMGMEPQDVAAREAALNGRMNNALRKSLYIRLQAALEKCAEYDYEGQMDKYKALYEQNTALKKDHKDLSSEREYLEECISDVSATIEKLDRWLQSEEPKSIRIRHARAGHVDPNAAIVPVNGTVEKRLMAESACEAIEDTIQELDHAFEKKKIPWDEYTKILADFVEIKFNSIMIMKRGAQVDRFANSTSIDVPSASFPRMQNAARQSSSFPLYPQISRPSTASTVERTEDHHVHHEVPNPFLAAARNMKSGRK